MCSILFEIQMQNMFLEYKKFSLSGLGSHEIALLKFHIQVRLMNCLIDMSCMSVLLLFFGDVIT